jgi:outer membrane immunogenic protein
MRKLLLTTVAFNVLALPAMAADLVPVKAPPPAAPSWTGFYIGGNVGGVFNGFNNSVDVTTTNASNNIQGDLNALGLTAGPAAAAAATGNVPLDSSTAIGGFQAGYNWQLAPTWVVGLEADIQGIATVGAGNGFRNTVQLDSSSSNEVATISATNKVDWLGTVRGRLGYLVTPKWLIYGTGGLAYGHASSSTSISLAPVAGLGGGFASSATSGAFSGTRVGWTAGAGAEYMFLPNWTVKAEYLHYDLGSVTYSNGSLNGVLAGSGLEFVNPSSSTTRFSGEIVRGGINYRF